MLANIRTRVAQVNIAFSSSKNEALIEHKMLLHTTLSIENHHYTSREKTQIFTMSDVLACVSVHCADQRQHPIPDFLKNLLTIRSKRVLT